MIWVCVVLIAIKGFVSVSAVGCDTNIKTAEEGSLGEIHTFPWLGVLRVHIHEGNTFKVALTGLVLVQEGYAIVNADDVVRIPKNIFKYDSRAMFIPKDGQAWFCKLVDYMTHPEYEYATMNTIALVELDPGKKKTFPVKPICWPPKSYNTTRDLHAIAFTDDNRQLEKSIYSVQHVERGSCDAFYNNAGLTEARMTPSHFVCAFAKGSDKNCVWDNGVVLASNSTKYWALVGFGIRGPGCAAPARFIDITQYFPWIESVTNPRDGDDKKPNFRKSAYDEGFKKKMRAGESQMDFITPDLTVQVQNLYPFDTRFIQNSYFTIDRIDEGAILIRNVSLPTAEGSCSTGSNELIYRETVKVFAEEHGFVSYRLSMYDLAVLNFSCTRISVTPVHCKDQATLYYTASIDNTEGLTFGDFGTTPEKILKVSPIKPIQLRPAQMTADEQMVNYKPGPHLKPLFLTDEDTPTIDIINYNIYFKFAFENVATIHVEVLGQMIPLVSSTLPTVPSTTPYWLRAGDEEEEYQDNPEEARRGKLDTNNTKTTPETETTPNTETQALSLSVSKKNNLEPLGVVRVPTPASPKLLKERVLFGAGTKIEGLRLIDIISVCLCVSMLSMLFNVYELNLNV